MHLRRIFAFPTATLVHRGGPHVGIAMPFAAAIRIVAVLCALLVGAVVPARAAVTTALTSASATVAPGADFDVFFDVTAAGSSFNGFDLVVGYDPAVLTLLPASPTTLQQGCLMTGGCSTACGNTFHRYAAAGDSVTVSNSLLCNQVVLSGPGHLYKLRFHAANVSAVTTIRIRRAKFYNAGLFVTPVTTADLSIGIGVVTGVGDGIGSVRKPLRLEPNPARSRVQFQSEDDNGGLVQVDVLDLQGRVLQRLAPTWLGPRGRFSWDARDADGARLPAGLYLVRVRRGHELTTQRLTLLP
jgi:hypothetical protein